MADFKKRKTNPTHEDLVAKIQAQAPGNLELIKVFTEIRRESFVPDQAKPLAHLDQPIEIPCDQTTSQPTLIALMIDSLHLRGSEKVLEIGTGYGYQTALLARLCKHVYSIERHPELTEGARTHLEKYKIRNVTFVSGDGTLGLPHYAPYDAIIGSAAIAAVPKPVADQLSEGGVLVHPIGPGGEEWVIVFHKKNGIIVETTRLTRASFVRMIGTHGHRSS